ncbi:N-acetylmuramoyl-L-alanine amidase [Candidatus Avoscillospira sp. LCP25S3_F1]|uniref:N-acetylmuramoyl-L-alanine amidase n=1 Tax=Candidatus Avoscillospira sp. LCP25S3_F1 TaxID=3438825 RepID=UPI003F92C40B
MNLLLIAGHGAGDPGSVGNGYQEATETRKVVAALSNALNGYCNVSTYPSERNAFSDYKAGALGTTARFSLYNVVLEVHFNALSASPKDGKTKGTEVFIPTTEQHMSLADRLCRNVSAVGFTNRGVKFKNYSVISTAKRSGPLAMLLEICFIDDPDDMQVYTSEFDAVIQAIADSIIQEYGLKKEDSPVTYEEFEAFMARYEAKKAAQQPDDWSAAARDWAERNGIVNGNDAGKMRYKSGVTREEVAQMLYNAVGNSEK